MDDRYLEWGPARHRAPHEQPMTGSTLAAPTWTAAADQRDADQDRPDDN